MTGSAGEVLGDTGKGAALGTAIMPGWGTAIGGALGLGYGLFEGGPSQASKDASAAQAAHVAQQKQNAITLENYRQASRAQYHQSMLNQMAAHQGGSNALASITGGHAQMPTSGQSWAEDPLTLAQTGIGAPTGSNYAGWDERTAGDGMGGHVVIHHQGIGDYVNGTALANGPGQQVPTSTVDRAPDGSQYRSTLQTNMVSAVPGGGLDPRQSSYAPQMPGGAVATTVPTAGLTFAPRRV